MHLPSKLILLIYIADVQVDPPVSSSDPTPSSPASYESKYSVSSGSYHPDSSYSSNMRQYHGYSDNLVTAAAKSEYSGEYSLSHN